MTEEAEDKNGPLAGVGFDMETANREGEEGQGTEEQPPPKSPKLKKKKSKLKSSSSSSPKKKKSKKKLLDDVNVDDVMMGQQNVSEVEVEAVQDVTESSAPGLDEDNDVQPASNKKERSSRSSMKQPRSSSKKLGSTKKKSSSKKKKKMSSKMLSDAADDVQDDVDEKVGGVPFPPNEESESTADDVTMNNQSSRSNKSANSSSNKKKKKRKSSTKKLIVQDDEDNEVGRGDGNVVPFPPEEEEEFTESSDNHLHVVQRPRSSRSSKKLKKRKSSKKKIQSSSTTSLTLTSEEKKKDGEMKDKGLGAGGAAVGITSMDNNNDSNDNEGSFVNKDVEQPSKDGEEEEEEGGAGTGTGKEGKQGFMEAARSDALRPFVIISSSYLLFTITDGAIRMIVLLHAYSKSFSALEVAIMFTLYELAGVFTNLAAGVMGAKWGIRFTLVCGLTLQLVAYSLLFGWQDDWTKTEAIIYITFAQMFAGVAKDLTKLGGKTVTKLVTPDEQDTKLFKLVSLITGWKNSLKGVGYFLGSALLEVSYEAALLVMMGLVVLAMPWAIFGLDKNLGMAKTKNASWKEIFVMDNKNLNWLSFARLFLFASRDFWFEVPLPFFLRSPSCEGLGTDVCSVTDDCTRGAICGIDEICENFNAGGGCGGLGVRSAVVGAFLGGYIILYGQVQSWTPQLVTGPLKQTPPNKYTEVFWGLINCIPTFVAWIVTGWGPAFENYNESGMIGWLVSVIISFAIIFAINSSIHSFLVVNYASKEKVAVSVGFYYMSNACGRLFGTLGSGILYTYVGEDFGDVAGSDAVAGFSACFLAGTICSLLAAVITIKIDDNKGGLKCGSCLTIVGDKEETTTTEDDDGDDGGAAKEKEDDAKDLTEELHDKTEAAEQNA